MSVERVAGSPWNQWPDVHGIGGRMAVESAVKHLAIHDSSAFFYGEERQFLELVLEHLNRREPVAAG